MGRHLNKLLRHANEDYGFAMDDHGFIAAAELIEYWPFDTLNDPMTVAATANDPSGNQQALLV